MKLWTIAGILVLTLTVALSSVIAQDSTSSGNQGKKTADETEKHITSTVNQLLGFVNSQELEKASQHMTPAARDAFASGMVQEAAMSIAMGKALKTQMGKMAAQLGIGGNEKLEATLKKHGLDDLGIAAAGQFSMSINGQDVGSNKNKSADATPDISKKILKILDKDGQRWKVLSEIASNASPGMSANPSLSGEVQGVELSENKQQAFVTLKPAASKAPRQMRSGGSMIQMSMENVSPGSVIKLVKRDDNWLYAGVDLTKTSNLPMPQAGFGGMNSFGNQGFEFGAGTEQNRNAGSSKKQKAKKKSKFGGDFDSFDKN